MFASRGRTHIFFILLLPLPNAGLSQPLRASRTNPSNIAPEDPRHRRSWTKRYALLILNVRQNQSFYVFCWVNSVQGGGQGGRSPQVLLLARGEGGGGHDYYHCPS